jgi:carboxyl-terminal processing protease
VPLKAKSHSKSWREAEAADEEDKLDELADPSKKEKPEDEAFVKEAAEILLDAYLTETPKEVVAKHRP